MSDLIVEIVRGLATGCIYALLALGLTLIFQVGGVVNFAQGALAAVGAYVLWSLMNQARLPFWPAVAVTIIVIFLLGALFQALLLQRLQRAPAAALIVTLGLLILLENGAIGLIWGYTSPTPPLWFNLPVSPFQQTTIGPVALSQLDLATIGVTAALILAFFGFLRYTRAGAGVRAVAQSAQGARLVGIRVDRVRLVAWGIGASIAAVAGILIAANPGQQSPTMAEIYMLSAFAGAVIGGLDNLVGAAVGALLIGIVQNLATFYLPKGLSAAGFSGSALVFLLLLIVLLLRPAGLFGVAVQRRV